MCSQLSYELKKRRLTLRILFHSMHQNLEAARDHSWPLPATTGGLLLGGFVFGGSQINVVRPGVQRHGSRATFSLEGLDHGQLFWRVFARHGHRSLASRTE